MKYLKITLLWEKRALFRQILQGAMSDYGALISFRLFLGIVVENVEILLVTSTKVYYLTIILSFLKFIFRFYHLYIVCSRLFHERTFLFNQFASHSRKSRVEKICCHDSLWHLTLILFRFAVNVKGLHIVCTPPFLLEGGGGWTSNQVFKKRGAWQNLNFFCFDLHLMSRAYTYCAPPPFLLGGGWASNQIFKTWGLGRTSTFREGCWERGDDFFHGGNAIVT